MTIDTKRLATDAAYWDECDPSGGEATHYCPEDAFHTEGWLKGNKNHAHFMFAGGGSWHSGSKIESNCIPRPQKPEVEWDGSEMVKAGHRLEARAGGNPWLRGEIMYRSEEGVVFRPDDGGCELFWRFCMFHVEFRPIRTKEQRDRDEAVDAALSLDEYPGGKEGVGGLMSRRGFCEKLYDAGMLRRPEDV